MGASTDTGHKLCKDCVNFRPFTVKFLFWNFRGPEDLSGCAAFPNLVTGAPGRFCDIEREFGPRCGPEGKLWVAK